MKLKLARTVTDLAPEGYGYARVYERTPEGDFPTSEVVYGFSGHLFSPVRSGVWTLVMEVSKYGHEFLLLEH